MKIKEVDITFDMAQKLAESLTGIAEVTSVFVSKREILLKGAPIIKLYGMTVEIESRLEKLGYKAEVISSEPELIVRLQAPGNIEKRRFPWANLILFLITGISTILAGAWQNGIDIITMPGIIIHDPIAVIQGGLPFSLSLLAILLFHEFGHYTAARIHKVNVTLPYFIPAPTMLGTFGAFIKSKSMFINKRQLLDVAVAGPLAGLAISIVVLIIGISNSYLVPISGKEDEIILGNSILYKLVIYLIKGHIPTEQLLLPNSVAFAGWVGLLVTMFNLLPIGQLDGGHIIYALFGKYQKYMAYVAMLGLLILSFWWSGWALWLLIAIILKPSHPPTLMDEIPIGRARRIVGYLGIAAFILCFMPVPIWYR
jgi:membrane-associated protease RseP (regulator of RpoE activity)